MLTIKLVFVLDMNRLSERKKEGWTRACICSCLHGLHSFLDDYDPFFISLTNYYICIFVVVGAREEDRHILIQK